MGRGAVLDAALAPLVKRCLGRTLTRTERRAVTRKVSALGPERFTHAVLEREPAALAACLADETAADAQPAV